MKKEKELELRLVEGLEVVASISATLETVSEYDEGQVFFQNPVTGEMHERVRDILVGWTEEGIEGIEELVELVAEDEDLLQKAWDMGIIEYFSERKIIKSLLNSINRLINDNTEMFDEIKEKGTSEEELDLNIFLKDYDIIKETIISSKKSYDELFDIFDKLYSDNEELEIHL